MQQRQLGRNGKQVGAVGLGCMSFAGVYGGTDMAESHATLARALELGVTHLIREGHKSRNLSDTHEKETPVRIAIGDRRGKIDRPLLTFPLFDL